MDERFVNVIEHGEGNSFFYVRCTKCDNDLIQLSVHDIHVIHVRTVNNVAERHDCPGRP